jgi:hypothetical protein
MQSVSSPIARPRYSSDTAVITKVDCVLPKRPEPNVVTTGEGHPEGEGEGERKAKATPKLGIA